MVKSPLLQKAWDRVCAVVRLAIYHPPHALSSYKIIVCEDRYLDVSPKSHERSKRMGANTPPPLHMSLSTGQHSSHEKKS